MNKLSIIIDSVLGAAVITLFVLFLVCRPCGKNSVSVASADSTGVSIAYVNLDSIIAQYTFAVEANDKLMSKQEDARVKLAAKATALQNEYRAWQQEAAAFQQKVDANAFLSRERAESEYQKIQDKQAALAKKQQDLQKMEDELTNEILVETQDLNLQLRDSLTSFLKEYNETAGYKVIFGNTEAVQNILVADEALDITDEVVALLNERHAATVSK